MFNKRMVYMAGNETQQQAPAEEKKDADAAKAKLENFFPKADKLNGKVETEYKANSIDQEKVRTDENARADIIAAAKFGKKFDSTVPGVDKDTLKQVKDALNKVPEDHFATKRMEVTIDDKTLYFVSIYDSTKKAPQLFYTNNALNPNERTMLRDVDDATYKTLTGKDREKKVGV